MVDVFDTSGTIADIAIHQNIQFIVRIANRNIDVVMIGLHQCFSIYGCITQP